MSLIERENPREIKFTPGINPYAAGSTLVEFGNTKVQVTASLEDSVRDYVLYLDYVKMPKTFYTIDQFGTFLKNKGYFTDPDYLSKLKKIYLKLWMINVWMII